MRFILALFLVVAVSSAQSTKTFNPLKISKDAEHEDGAKKITNFETSSLQALILEGHELHPSLKTRQVDEPIQQLPPGMVLPRNPYTSTDAGFVEAVARSSSMGKIPRDGVRSALYARYIDDDKKELGMYGLEAASILDADWREAALRKIWSYNEKAGRATVHRKGLLLVVVWHDVSPECWAAVNAKVAKRLTTPAFEIKSAGRSGGPSNITRSIIQDRVGNIWMATWEGVFRYNGESFENMTREVSSARFFSALEDRKGNLWFGSIGSGIFRYDGKSFQHFTTKDGLLNNDVTSIYEDQVGDFWFGVNGGLSRYNGETFRNYLFNKGTLTEDKTGKIIPDFTRPPNEVNDTIEDKEGRIWFATRGEVYVYDGKEFSVFSHQGISFTNARSILEDRKGNIWIGGQNGLWRYDGSTLTNITKNFVGYIYEDTRGNMWTSSEKVGGNWVLSRYDANSLEEEVPIASEIGNAGMIFGILEAYDGGVWFGALDGAHRYNGYSITHFKGGQSQKK